MKSLKENKIKNEILANKQQQILEHFKSHDCAELKLQDFAGEKYQKTILDTSIKTEHSASDIALNNKLPTM